MLVTSRVFPVPRCFPQTAPRLSKMPISFRPSIAPSELIRKPSSAGDPRMNSTLCTIGFAGKTAEEFFRLLQEAGVTKVIDVRENRGGQLSGFAKFPDVAFFRS